MIARLHQARVLATAQHGHGTRNVAYRHLVTVFLDLELLEFDELGSARLEVEAAAGLVGLTVLARAHDQGHECC